MLKKEKKTHQSPSSKTKADEERKNWLGFFFFGIVRTDAKFWGLVAVLVGSESVPQKTEKRIRS